MRRLVFAALATTLLFISSHAQGTCPTTAPANQSRVRVKSRRPPDDIDVARVELADVLSWENPANVKDPKVRASQKIISPHEAEAYEVEGDLWRIKFEMNDCDLHLEISEPGAGRSARRIIVEITSTPVSREARKDMLALRDQWRKDKMFMPGGIDLKKPVRLRFIGYAFYDAHHYSGKHPKIGTGHGSAKVKTLWEIHPVWDVKPAGQ